MPKSRQLVFIPIVISLATVSCVQDVFLDARDEPQVVVECVLSDEPVQTLYLVYTKGASRETAPELTDAVATLIDLTEGKEAGRFQRTADGSWQLEYAAAPAHNYRLEVSVPGREPIWAEQTMPQVPNISVAWKLFQFGPRSDFEDLIGLNVGGYMGDNNGYEFSIDSPQDPVWFYGINYPTAESPGERTQSLCTDYPEADDFNLDETLSSTGKYSTSIEHSFWGQAYFQTTTYPALEGFPLHKHYLRFPASNGIKANFSISGSFRGYLSDVHDFIRAEKRPAELHWLAVSEDYDIYIKSSEVILGFKTSTDMADMFLRDNNYSNIHGAIGLFGAKIEDKIEWEGSLTEFEDHPFLLTGLFKMREHMMDEGKRWYRPYQQFRFRANGGFEDSPFELLLFEVWKGEPWPDWAIPEYPNEMSYVITDNAQLEEFGLDRYGPVDFTKKTVLLVDCTWMHDFPVSIGYGRIKHDCQRVNIFYDDFTAGQYCPFLTTTKIEVESYPDPFASRIAILVDKQDNIFPRWCVSELGTSRDYSSDLKATYSMWQRVTDDFSWNK